MKKMKSLFALLLALLLLVPMEIMGAYAIETETAEPVVIRISDGETTDTYEVMRLESDLYFPVELFGELTNYTFINGSDMYGYQLGKKLIRIDPANGDMFIAALNYTGNVGELLTIDNEDYISASALLPWLNVACNVNDNGVFEIIPDGISLWEIVDELSYNDYMFKIYEEYGDSVSSIAGLTAMTMFDTIINMRWDRLVPADGTLTGTFNNGSLYDFNCYVSALTEMATDDTLASAEAEKEIKNIVNVNKGLDKIEEYFGIDEERIQYDAENYLRELGTDDDIVASFYDLTETWQNIREGIRSYEQVSKYLNVLSFLKAYELAMKADGEYRNYITWLSGRDTDDTVFNLALDKTSSILDENQGFLFSAYIDMGENLLKDLPDDVLEAIINNSMNSDLIDTYNSFNASFFGSLDTYLKISKVVFDKVFGVTDGFEKMAKASVSESIQDYCWNLAAKLQLEDMTQENIEHIRQSFLVALKASKMCYQGMQETMDSNIISWITGTDNSELMNYKIAPIEEKIVDLVASADVTENDSVDGKEEYQTKLKEIFDILETHLDVDTTVSITLNWTTKSENTGELMEINSNLYALLYDGTSLFVSEDHPFDDSEGTVAELIDNSTVDSGSITININCGDYPGGNLFRLDLSFDSGLDNELSSSDAVVTISIGGTTTNFNAENIDMYRSYTGVWFWGIAIENGVLAPYDDSWIEENNLYKDEREDAANLDFTFIRTVLSTIGTRTFANTSELSVEEIGLAVAGMLDCPYNAYNTGDYVPYTINSDYHFIVNDADFIHAANVIYGQSLTLYDFSISELNDYGGWEISDGIFSILGSNGRGGKCEVLINDVAGDSVGMSIYYTFNLYGTAEASTSRVPTDTFLAVALFKTTGDIKYPYQLISIDDNLANHSEFF